MTIEDFDKKMKANTPKAQAEAKKKATTARAKKKAEDEAKPGSFKTSGGLKKA